MFGLAPDYTTLNVTKFPSARALTASFERLDAAEPQTIPWLEQLVALPQLTRVELDWGDISPGRFLMQLPAGCELKIITWGRTLSESLPHSASLAHLVTLVIQDCNPSVDFGCLAPCPNLRNVKLHSSHVDNLLDWVDLSTLNYVPDRCLLTLNFEDAAMHMGSLHLPAGWRVAPGSNAFCSKDDDDGELIFFRDNSQDCTDESDL